MQHISVIVMDTTGPPRTRAAVELAARMAEEGCYLQRRDAFVEILPIENIDNEVRNDNRIWNLLLNADSIVFVTSFYMGGMSTDELKRFLRISNRHAFNIPRVSCLSVGLSMCANAMLNQDNEHVCNGGVNQVRQWAMRNNMTWVMDASITIHNEFIERDYENWKEICKLVGEGVVV
jgi:multimeric flavodoxin WrbA